MDKKVSILFVIFLLVGTTISNVAGFDANTNNNENIYQVDSEAALLTANKKLIQLDKNDGFHISFKNYYSDEKISFYMFILEPKGYIIVSGDYRLPPILAYSLTSYIDNYSLENSPLISLLKADIQARIEYFENEKDHFIKHPEWSLLLKHNQEIMSNTYFEQWPPEGSTLTEGWVETQWHQDAPFNNFCPLDNGERSVAGCPSIVIAQILNYHKETHSTRFNDSDDYYHNYVNHFTIDDDYEEYGFLSFPELNSYLETLDQHYDNNIEITDEDKAALTFACGVAAEQVYTEQVSGTFGVSQAYDAYQKFNCASVELLDATSSELYEKVIDNIKNAYPVHLALVTPGWDAGHNLVIDGYNTDNFYHLNFGWGGSYDGWYLLPDDDMPFELTVIEGIIVDILKDDTGPDLKCEGSLIWNDVTPEDTITGSFFVKNIGEPGSQLNWKIESTPEWGSWSFSQLNGDNLTPEDDAVQIDVTVVAPNRKNREYSAGIKIVNNERHGDIDYVDVILSTPLTKETTYTLLFQKVLSNFPILHKLLSCFIEELFIRI